MTQPQAWNAHPAQTNDELMDILFSAAAGLKTQVLSSPALAEKPQLKEQISKIADDLSSLQSGGSLASAKTPRADA